ncbi:MAG: DUF1385 domain-containing protein [bacterium]|nr:DUF1385 domain-containing protein [bacterium]
MEFIGGQAVIEGVLMKSGSRVAIAVRDQEGKIKIKEEKHTSITKKYKNLNIPFVRGPIILFETTILGLKALNYSANMNLGDQKEEKFGTVTLIATVLFSLLFALALFKLLPLGIAQITANNFASFENRYLFNLLEGLTKITILILYIYLISLMPDIRRTFQYHGAEHKVVNAYENNDLKNAKKYSRIHVRCGTSFILFVFALSIIVYLFLPIDISFLSKYGLRLLLLPVIAGIGYELIRISPKWEKNIFFKIIMTPGLLLQRLTTREPNEEQLEVAKAALNAVK